MTDAEIVRLFAESEARWHSTLAHIQNFHRGQLGRVVLPVNWMRGDSLGERTWYGFYWKIELFWFGYGLKKESWCPLIEADRRSPQSAVWYTLGEALPQVWNISDTPNHGHLRLWASNEVANGQRQSHRDWFLERSRELHEFAIRDR